MKRSAIASGTTDWSAIPAEEYEGEAGGASWRTRQLDGIRARMVESTPGNQADPWCVKGHAKSYPPKARRSCTRASACWQPERTGLSLDCVSADWASHSRWRFT